MTRRGCMEEGPSTCLVHFVIAMFHRLLLFVLLLWRRQLSSGFPNQAGSCDGVGQSIHTTRSPIDRTTNSTSMHLRVNGQRLSGMERIVKGTPSVVLELTSADALFKGVLMRVEQVYPIPKDDTLQFDVTPQSRNVQSIHHLCANYPIVQAISHTNPSSKSSIWANLTLHDDSFRIFAIDVFVVMANNHTVGSIYTTQSYRLRLEPQKESTSVHNHSVATHHHLPIRSYPQLNPATISTTANCQLCPTAQETLRHLDQIVRWINGTELSCASLAQHTTDCRTLRDLVRDGACGGCRSTCELPCVLSKEGAIPMIDRPSISCALVADSLDRLVSIRTCAVSQALVKAHCGCILRDETIALVESSATGQWWSTTTTAIFMMVVGWCIVL